MHYRKTYMHCISIFSNIVLADQSKPCTQIYLRKIANCITLQLAIRFLNKMYACFFPKQEGDPVTVFV